MGYYVQQTTDGGYIITGKKDDDVWLIKTDNAGNKMWDKTFGGADDDVGRCVQQTTDEGYIITGLSGHTDYGCKIWLIKTDSTGNKMWDKTFSGTTKEYNFGNCVQQTTDEGYIIIGYRYGYWEGNSDVWLIKTDKNGNKMWDKIFDESYYDRGCYVQQTTDGGFIISGSICDFPAESIIWLIKTNSAGNKEWDKTFGLTGYDQGFCVQQTTDGGYIIVGETGEFYIYYDDIWLVKTDSTGNIEWDKTFGGADIDSGRCVRQTTDGGYIITGETDGDVWLIKTDGAGNMEWDNIFKMALINYNFGKYVRQITDGGYIITEETKSFTGFDNCSIKTDKYGKSGNKAATCNMFLQKLQGRFPLLRGFLISI